MNFQKIIFLIGLMTFMTTVDHVLLGQLSRSSPIERTVHNLNNDWLYLEVNTTDLQVASSHSQWQSVTLPHTWNQWDTVDNLPGYRRDGSWYMRTLDIDQGDAKYVLYFEGVNITSQIYINGKQVGEHVGGYVGFEIDITDHVERGEPNTLMVRADNTYNRDIIPSQKADFFIYGGITRDVWLKTLPRVNINKVKVTTTDVSKLQASTTLNIDIDQFSSLDKSYSIVSTIVDRATGEVVLEGTLTDEDFDQASNWSLPKLSNPKLWSPSSPHLYDVNVQLFKKNKLIDEVVETVGYRWFEFEDYGGFYLNGERLLLRGTHRHEEHAGYGSAMTNTQHRNDIEQIKEMGANFLRLGHYPQDPEIYKACDELGIIVWDELPWCRGGMGHDVWKDNTESLFREQINQNYNHPSIFFWSLGNEVYWLPDFEDGDNEENVKAYVKHLNDVAHDLDPTRMTSIRKYYAGSDLVDVFSPSIWSGWYAGVYTNYGNTLEKNQTKYPRFLHMEYGGSSHVGRHTETPITGTGTLNEDNWAEVSNQVNIKNIAKEGDWTENYIVDLFDWYLSVSESNATFAGNAQWAFKDFGTPLRPENAIPYLNQKGLVDRAGKPKDAYYVFKSYWSDIPFTYIESHTWTDRSGPVGQEKKLSIYSNCDKVELFHQGKSLGTKDRIMGEFPASGLTWDILFEEGENDLLAVGYIDGEMVTDDAMVVNYSYQQGGKADRISLSYKVLDNGHYLVEAKVVDKNNLRVLDYEKYIYFTRDGQGELLKNYGTPTRSQVIQMANGYAAIELVPDATGRAIIEARNQDFKGSYLTIEFENK